MKLSPKKWKLLAFFWGGLLLGVSLGQVFCPIIGISWTVPTSPFLFLCIVHLFIGDKYSYTDQLQPVRRFLLSCMLIFGILGILQLLLPIP